MRRSRRLILIIAVILAVAAGVYAASYYRSAGMRRQAEGKKAVEGTVQGSLQSTTQLISTQTGEDTQTEKLNQNDVQESTPKDTAEVSKKNEYIKVKALYLSGPVAGSQKLLDHYISLVNSTELNALVIDIKEAGYVNYESSVPMVKQYGLYKKYYKPPVMLKKLHDNGIYVIGRLVTFRDPGLAGKRKDLAIKRPDGSLWVEGELGPWTNPYIEQVWQYNIDIAKEAIDMGFDEIQFDYVRFPSTSRSNRAEYGQNAPQKGETIAKFLNLAQRELGTKGVNVSADVFGIICESVSDGKAIGQELEIVGKDISAISPMVYPSHYAPGQIVNGIKFDKPDFKPYEVVYNTLKKCKDRLTQVPGYKARIRPYLQDFTASYLHKGLYQTYGAEEVRQQIKAVYDAGYDEWILWDGRNTYSEAALAKE